MQKESLEVVSFFGSQFTSAVFSEDRKYRYRLDRCWDSTLKVIAFIMLNPSKAGVNLNDPTVRKCIGYARRWGYGHLIVGNLFGFCSTKPRGLLKSDDPVGNDNEKHWIEICRQVDTLVVAWGAGGAYLDQDEVFLDRCDAMCVPVKCLNITKKGYPQHPLYVSYDTVLQSYKKQRSSSCEGYWQ